MANARKRTRKDKDDNEDLSVDSSRTGNLRAPEEPSPRGAEDEATSLTKKTAEVSNSLTKDGDNSFHMPTEEIQREVERRSRMAKLVLKSLSVLLGLFFVFVGITKITPYISKDLFKDLRKEYAQYAKVLPGVAYLKVKVPSKWYRRGVGGTEILCGLCLAFVPFDRVKQVANTTLILLMVVATYNHYMVGDKFDRMAPSLVFFFMLSCRLIVEYQTKKKEKAMQLKLEEGLRQYEIAKAKALAEEAPQTPAPECAGCTESCPVFTDSAH